MPDVMLYLRRYSFAFALALVVVLVVANVIALPSWGSPSSYAQTLGEFAPFALAAMASTPAILSGNGGLDISIGPQMTLVNVVFVVVLMGHGLGGEATAIPILLGMGLAIGLINGFLVAILHYQPVVATLCAFFVIGGVALEVASSPASAPANWSTHLAHSVGPIPGGVLTIGAPLLLLFALRRTAYVRNLLAVGANDAAAYSAGVNVTAIRVSAYALGGLIAAVGGIALTGLLQSADASLGTQYTLVAIAAVSLGGTPLGGGRGGIVGSVFGAATIYLIQNLLSALNVQSLWLQVVYGALLVVSVVLGRRLTSAPRAQRGLA
jgi:ribose transport system permease protein